MPTVSTEEYKRRKHLGLCSRCGVNPRRASDCWCTPCSASIEKKYGVTQEQYDKLLLEQDGVCAICKQEETLVSMGTLSRLAVDHCHQTGQTRGLLCRSCNVGLGNFRDNPELLRQAASYLEETK